MPNPKVATTLAYLAGLLGAASAALMAGQITGHIPIGLALYATMGAVTAAMIWLAMWTVNKVQAQVELLRRHEEAPTGEIKAGTPTFRSTPVAVAVTIPAPRVSDVETFQRRPTLSSIPAALIGQIFRLGVEGEKTRRERP